MTPRFNRVFPWLMSWEGSKYEDIEGDEGGPTKYGIDHRSHPDVDIASLTLDQAKQIYWDSYWTHNGCDALPDKVGECHFNACVNCGTSRADKFLLASDNDPRVYLQQHENFYKRLADQKQSLRKFLPGWLNRTEDLKRFLDL